MSALGAFFRGAAGPGMLALADSYERRDAEERLRAQRAADLAAEQAFRAEQADKDRMARYGTDGTEPGLLGARRASSGGGGGGGGGGDNNQALYDYAARNGVSLAQARADFASNESGIPNRTKQVVTNEADLDGRDRRTGTGAETKDEPDLERMRKVWAEANRALAEAGPRAKSNYEQLTAGDGNAQRNKITGGMLSGALTPAQTAEAVAASNGKGANQNARVNEFTGKPTAIGDSEIRENNASAGASSRSNRGDGKDGKPDTAWLKDEYKAVTQEIAKARAGVDFDPKKNPQQQALLDRALDLEGRLSAAGQSVDDKAIASAVAATLAASKNNGKPAPTQADARKSEKPAAKPTEAADPLAGMSRQQARAKRAELAAELKRWESKPGAEAIVAELRDLIDRIDTGRF